jgi:toxin ParE1/3/4
MATYQLTNKAVNDLSRIWNYTFDNWSEQQADKYYHLLLDCCQNLANNPDLGKKYEGVAKELFGFRINRHLIFYRKMRDKSIEITRILHEQMDIKNRVKE